MVEFPCPSPACGTKLKVADDLAGKKVKCPKCQTVTVAPVAQPVASEQPAPAERPDAGREMAERKESGVEALDTALTQMRGQIEPFEVERELAHGGMGAVLLARDRALARPIAVKVIKPQIAESEEHRVRFLDEAQITAQLEHPNIVPVHELGKNAQGDLYVTMKLVKGKSLAQILKDLRQGGEGQVASGKQRRQKREEEESQGPEPTAGPVGSDSPLATSHWSLAEFLGVFLKVCDAMAFAHSRGVIHRDLKPANVMVGEFGEVLVMDWGLAKVVASARGQVASDAGEEKAGVTGAVSGEDEFHGASGPKPDTRNLTPESDLRRADTAPATPHSPLATRGTVRSVRSDSGVAVTLEGAVTGTPAYMPPEQAEGKIDQIDHRSDIYSLGAILYEILTLERPIEGDTLPKVLLNVADGKVIPPNQRTPNRHIPKELSAVVMKAMAKNRRKRYQSVQDLSQDIKLFLEGRAVSAKHDTFLEAFTKLVKRNKGVSAAVAAAAIFLAVSTSVFVLRLKNERDRALESERRAVANEQKATAAEKRQRETAIVASERLAKQAVRAAEYLRWEEADQRLTDAETVCPDGPWPLFARGRFAQIRKEHDKAIELLSKAMGIPPKSDEISKALDGSRAFLKDIEAANKLIADGGDVSDWRALEKLSELLMTRERWSEAEGSFARALEAMERTTNIPPAEKEIARDRISHRQGEAKAWIACQGFYDSIKNLPAEEQAKRVAAKLTEVNGQPIGFASVDFKEGKWVGCDFSGQPLRYLVPLRGMGLTVLKMNSCTGIRDLSPLKGMPLTRLECAGGQVRDLSPLEGMPLTYLLVDSQKAGMLSDLSPLRGMQLTFLSCNGTKVSDLSPLKGMPLTGLRCDGTLVADLSPLEGMQLTFLSCGQTKVTDLSPLKGMPLKQLTCLSTQVSDLSPLKGMPLTFLNCGPIPVTDLSPLKGMPLTELHCGSTQVSDLSPLKGMPLTYLDCSTTQVRDMSPLKGMPLRGLTCYTTALTDLSPLTGMALTLLSCGDTQVSDLSPLKGMPLTALDCNGTQVSDLSPLKGMPLTTRLQCQGTLVSDLSPLEGMNLKTFAFTPRSITRGMEIVRAMKTIEYIGTGSHAMWKSEEFWKKYDAGEFK